MPSPPLKTERKVSKMKPYREIQVFYYAEKAQTTIYGNTFTKVLNF